MQSDLDREEGEVLSRHAAELIVLTHDDPGSEMNRDYWRWLKQSPQHVAAALHVHRVYALLRRINLAAVSDDPGGGETSNVVELHPDKRREWRTVPLRQSSTLLSKVAAMLLIGFLIGIVAIEITAWVNSGIETVAGEWRVLVLEDGSKVRIGPRTRMRVRFDDRRRFIRLTEGDVMFEVAHDPRRPFIVDTGVGTARAVGTAFGVTRVDDWMVVTVTEGVVAVTRANAPSAHGEALVRAATASVEPRSVEISVGEQVKVSNGRLHPVRRVDVLRELAWVREKLIFERQTIASAAHEFNRRNRLQIDVADRSLAARPVVGVFNAADPLAFVEFLEHAASAEANWDGPDVLRVASARTTKQGAPTAVRSESR